MNNEEAETRMVATEGLENTYRLGKALAKQFQLDIRNNSKRWLYGLINTVTIPVLWTLKLLKAA